MCSVNRPGHIGHCALALLMVVASATHAADGDVDPTFSTDGVAYADWGSTATRATHLAVSTSGALFVTATVRASSGTNRSFAAAKFRANGSLESTFGFLGLRTIDFDLVPDGFDILNGAHALPNGALMLLGTAEVPGNAYAPAMARLTAAGDADPTFGSGGRRVITSAPWPLVDIDIQLAIPQPDGHYLFGGWCDIGTSQRAAVVLRVDANGVADPQFGDGGWASIEVPWPSRFTSIALDPIGRIVLAGFDGDLANEPHVPLLARFLADGSADTSFGIGTGYVRLSALPDPPPQGGWLAQALAVDQDASLLLGVGVDEDMDTANAGIVRVRANGTLDTAFGVSGLRRLDFENGTSINAINLQSDRRIVAVGYIMHNGSGRDVFAARLLTNGSLDTTFDGNGIARYELDPEVDTATAVSFSAGRPVLGGYAKKADSWDGFALRLQSDAIFSDGFD